VLVGVGVGVGVTVGVNVGVGVGVTVGVFVGTLAGLNDIAISAHAVGEEASVAGAVSDDADESRYSDRTDVLDVPE